MYEAEEESKRVSRSAPVLMGKEDLRKGSNSF